MPKDANARCGDWLLTLETLQGGPLAAEKEEQEIACKRSLDMNDTAYTLISTLLWVVEVA